VDAIGHEQLSYAKPSTTRCGSCKCGSPSGRKVALYNTEISLLLTFGQNQHSAKENAKQNKVERKAIEHGAALRETGRIGQEAVTGQHMHACMRARAEMAHGMVGGRCVNPWAGMAGDLGDSAGKFGFLPSCTRIIAKTNPHSD